MLRIHIMGSYFSVAFSATLSHLAIFYETSFNVNMTLVRRCMMIIFFKSLITLSQLPEGCFRVKYCILCQSIQLNLEI